MKKLNSLIIFLLPLLLLFGFSDYQTGVVEQVNIGTQVWMKTNLDLCHFRNGDSIPHAKTKEEWKKAGREGKPAWCHYGNDSLNRKQYGKLYNWYAVNDPRGLAPEGWHIPTDAEWSTLATSIGGKSIAGIKMKDSIGWDQYRTQVRSRSCQTCMFWTMEQTDRQRCSRCRGTGFVRTYGGNARDGRGNNESGFNGKPGGSRDHLGRFSALGSEGYFWTATARPSSDGPLATFRSLTSRDQALVCDFYKKDCGFSVRCVKNQ